MKKSEVREKIFGILKEVIEDEERVPTSVDENINDILNSVEFVMMIVEIESMFGIEIDDNDFEINNMDTVENLADLIMKYLEK